MIEKDVKTKQSVLGKGAIKVTDKAGMLARRSATRFQEDTKECAERMEDSPVDYAREHISQAAEETTERAGRAVRSASRSGIKRVRGVLDKSARDWDARKSLDWKQGSGQSYFKKSTKNAERVSKHATRSATRTIKTGEKATDAAVKASGRGIKTAEQSARVAKKAAEASLKASERAAKVAAETARRAAEATYKAAVALGKTVVAASKGIAAGVSKLGAVIVAGGMVSVVIIVVLCLAAVVVGYNNGMI